MNWFKIVIQRFDDFQGRSRRKEFWMFFLIAALIGVFLSVLDKYVFKWNLSFSSNGPLETIFQLIILLPFLAVVIRRLHDIGKKWTWVFIAFIPFAGLIWLIYLLSKKGMVESNKYGPDSPKIHYL